MTRLGNPIPEVGQAVRVRNRLATVRAVEPYDARTAQGRLHIIDVEYLDDFRYPEAEQLLWEVEATAQPLGKTSLPSVDANRPDSPQALQAFVNAHRWTRLNRLKEQDGVEDEPLLGVWNSAIQVHPYQLEPVIRALSMPRVSLLLADGVGLGKTIQSGLVLEELLLRRRIRRILVICPAMLQRQWKYELRRKFNLDFEVIDSDSTFQLRRRLGIDTNPWKAFPRIITSMDYLRMPDVLQQFLQASGAGPDAEASGPTLPHAPWDLLIVDECHHFAPQSGNRASQRTRMLREIRFLFEHRIFASATPHNGKTVCFTGLLELLDPIRFQMAVEMDEKDKSHLAEVRIRRLKDDINKQSLRPPFAEQLPPVELPIKLTPKESALYAALRDYLVLGAAARKSGDSLLRPKVHFFLRGLDEMVVALDGTDAAPEMNLFLSLAEAKEQHGARHDDSYFPVLTCRSCGQHFFEKWYTDLEFARGSKNQLKDLDHGIAALNDDGTDNAYWSTSPAETGTRLLVTNRLLEEADGGPATKSGKWPKAWFCRQCGAMHRSSSPRCLADGCLVATPTLEMGVNIGALDMALMRNVPPRPANYWQRAGRAGREERMAVVVTYCRRSPHDRYFFDDPLKLLGGTIEAPTFNLRNPLMVAKHMRSAILSELLLRSRKAGDDGERVRELLKQLFPVFIRSYLLDEDNHFRDTPTSTVALGELLNEVKDSLADRLVTLFAKHWPEEAADLANRAAIERTIVETAHELDAVIKRLHRRLSWARSTRSELHKKKDTGLIEREEEQLLRRCDEFINSIVSCDRATYGLTVLASEGFLPGYGVYEGGVTASARRGFARQSGPRSFDLSRNNVVALREFVPGNRLYANRGTFYVSRYHLGADETARIRTLHVDPVKGYVTEQAHDAAYGQSGGLPIDAIPLTDLDLAHESRITEDEHLRFAMPVSVLGRLRKRNRGGKAFKIGDREVSHVRGQGIELVNIGEAGRVKQGEIGHWICSVCGAAKTPYAVPAEIQQFLKIHKERCGKDVVRMALAAQAEVDMLQFHAVADDAEGINIGEGLRTAATRLLDMGQEDLQLLIVKKPDDKLDLLVYDPMPGGSGLLEQMLARWSELIASAKGLLGGCPQACDTACYSCLKTFRNQFHHPLLNRHRGLELMEGLNVVPQGYRDIVPMFEEEHAEEGSPSNPPEARLVRILRDHHFPVGECRKRITTSLGIPTEPDWLHEPTKVAVYLDGMSRSLHGDPNIARKDLIIRQALEVDDYKVIVVQKRDLDDPQAVRQHLRNIGQAMGRTDLANS